HDRYMRLYRQNSVNGVKQITYCENVMLVLSWRCAWQEREFMQTGAGQIEGWRLTAWYGQITLTHLRRSAQALSDRRRIHPGGTRRAIPNERPHDWEHRARCRSPAAPRYPPPARRRPRPDRRRARRPALRWSPDPSRAAPPTHSRRPAGAPPVRPAACPT